MNHRKGEKILNAMERKAGGLALPQILRWIAGFQVLVWILSIYSPEFLETIGFDRGKILSGEVWRLFSWVIFPRATSLLFIVVATLFMFFINDAIEGVWGAFRLNIYVISTAILLTIIGMLFGTGLLLAFIFYSSAFLAFATLHPNQIIQLMFVIPVKAKWLGIANASILVGMVLTSGLPIVFGIMAIFGLLPYLLVFAPSFYQGLKAATRRSQFAAETNIASSGAFHVCATCQATDETHPDREFRVAADGEEHCNDCLEKTKDS